jgi:hypothetical protein
MSRRIQTAFPWLATAVFGTGLALAAQAQPPSEQTRPPFEDQQQPYQDPQPQEQTYPQQYLPPEQQQPPPSHPAPQPQPYPQQQQPPQPYQQQQQQAPQPYQQQPYQQQPYQQQQQQQQQQPYQYQPRQQRQQRQQQQQAYQQQPPGDNWLLELPQFDDRFARIEHQFGGFSESMRIVGQRYEHAFEALVDDNLPLAAYHWGKLREAIERGYTRRPERRTNAESLFLNSAWRSAMDAFESNDIDEARSAFLNARDQCMACHTAEDVTFMNDQPLFRRTTSFR